MELSIIAALPLDPHDIVSGRTPKTVRHVRRYPDGTIYAQEHQIKGKKLEFRSTWKQVAGGSMATVLSASEQRGENRGEK